MRNRKYKTMEKRRENQKQMGNVDKRENNFMEHFGNKQKNASV